MKTIVISTHNKKNLGGKLDKRALPLVYRRAMQHLRSGQMEKAEVGFGHVLDADPKHVSALYGMARIDAARGELNEAITKHLRLQELSPNGYEASFVLGRAMQIEGKLAEAGDAFAQGVEREPADADVYFDLGQILFRIGLYELAIAAYDVTAELEPDFPNIHQTRMNVVKSRDRQSKDERASLAQSHAPLISRISKLKAIAKALDRTRPKSDVPLVLEWNQPKGPERPFSFSRNATPTAGVVKATGQKG
jgi:tetratricopeptide (TPR) repeat protein